MTSAVSRRLRRSQGPSTMLQMVFRTWRGSLLLLPLMTDLLWRVYDSQFPGLPDLFCICCVDKKFHIVSFEIDCLYNENRGIFVSDLIKNACFWLQHGSSLTEFDECFQRLSCFFPENLLMKYLITSALDKIFMPELCSSSFVWAKSLLYFPLIQRFSEYIPCLEVPSCHMYEQFYRLLVFHKLCQKIAFPAVHVVSHPILVSLCGLTPGNRTTALIFRSHSFMSSGLWINRQTSSGERSIWILSLRIISLSFCASFWPEHYMRGTKEKCLHRLLSMAGSEILPLTGENLLPPFPL